MAKDTRELFLDKAEALFAERGFYGTSIAAIADELGLTKQALLHHFGSKEKVYGEVLKRISDGFEALAKSAQTGAADPTVQLKSFLMHLFASPLEETAPTRLLMRELLDNKRRADSAGTWYLKPFLERLIHMVRAVPNWRDASDAEALGFAYQILGAINYYHVSQPTLTGIFGENAYAELGDAFPQSLERLIEAGLAAR